ncbi:MAG TPA: hypothetical protein VMF35_14130 [Acidimicrobiales bacterium]|nr:hypothetical protein [Acidimicrobiales bacterium]
MRRRRETKTIEFWPPELADVPAALASLRQAGSGWVNLLPGVDEEAAEPEPAAGLFAFFGNRAPPVSMATLMPAAKERRDQEGVTVGIMHPTGGKAVARLAEAGVTIPDGWMVQQDHARRGLLVRTTPAATEADIIEWSVRAGTELCRTDMTGQWRAVVYLPA